MFFFFYEMLLIYLCILLFVNGLTDRSDSSILYSRIGIIIMVYSIIIPSSNYYMTYIQSGLSILGGLFNVTSITYNFQIFICFICALILIFTSFYPRKKESILELKGLFNILGRVTERSTMVNKTCEQFTIIEYTLIIIFTVCGACLLLSSADLGSMYLCIELQSFSLYIISSIHRNSESSTGSALTYFLLGGLSSCFILLGIGLIYANSGLTNLDSIYTIISDSEIFLNYSTLYIHTYVYYSLLLISVGFLFKIAAAPFHWWSPDVYDGVPTIVTTFIAIMGKLAILILLMELVHYAGSLIHSTYQAYSWTTGLSISCLLSLIIGTVAGLTQTRIKKLLAYSTISHVGFILLALTVHTIESYQAFIFYIIQYIITNFNVFIILIAIGFSLYFYYTNLSEYNDLTEKNNSPIQLISQLKGYFSVNPVLALCLAITMFSFIGLPPLTGFFAKQMVLSTALDNDKVVLVLIGVLTSVIGAVYYLIIIKTIYFDSSDYIKPYIFYDSSLTSAYSITLSIINLIILIFIIIPNEILNLCNILSIVNFGYNDI